LRYYLFKSLMKKIGFLSFGHWADHPAYKTRSAADTLLQPIELAVSKIECTGDSMINAFIPPKAKLVVDKSVTAKNGDMVVAVMNGDFTVKFLKKDVKCWLIPGTSSTKK
jgi:SOS-response transcriptional repressor LexA